MIGLLDFPYQIPNTRKEVQMEMFRLEELWRHIMEKQRELQTVQTRVEAILCNLRNQNLILCKRENASESPRIEDSQ